MIVQAILHASFEPLGAIQSWIEGQDYKLHIAYPYKGDKLPEVASFDMLIIMGGPQSPLALDKYPYLIDEIDLIKKAIVANKKVLGFCLGAQLIGEALGAKTERSPHKEIGVWPIKLNNDGLQDKIFRNFPAAFTVAHWHNDMPGVPEGAVVLAESAGCPRQIIRFSDKIYGFQCHPEMTRKLLERLCDKCADDLTEGEYVQSPEQMLSSDFDKINKLVCNFLESFISLE